MSEHPWLNDNARPYEVPEMPTPEMLTAGSRSIGNTMRQENHNERARACWKAMCDSYLEGTIEPTPKGKSK